MTTKSKREKRERRYSDAKEVADQMGQGFTPTSYTLPDGVKAFRFKEEKTYRLNFLPFIVGEGNPHADEGMLHFERTYYVHSGIGPDNGKFVCPYKNSNKKCPICKFKTKLAMDPKTKKEAVRALDPKMRQFYAVIDLDDEDSGIQVFETAYFKSFGEMLKNKIKAGEAAGIPYENFFHLEDGYILLVTTEEDSFNGKTFYKPSNIEMKKRKVALDEELLDQVPCLDNIIKELPYDELEEIFSQNPKDDEDSDLEEEDDDEGETSGKSSKKNSQKASNKSTSSSKKHSKKKEEDDNDEEDEDEIEEDSELEEEDEKPARKAGKKPPKDDEDDEEIEEDSELDGEEESTSLGDRVKGSYKNKTFKGEVTRVKKRKGECNLITVETDGGNQRVMDADDLEIIKKAKHEEEDDDEGEDEEEAPSRSSKTSSGKASKTTKPSKKSSKKDEDDDDDDDLPFDDSDIEDDE